MFSTAWLIDVPKDRENEYRETIKQSTIVRTQLTKLIEKEIAELDIVKEADYENAAWAYKQADRLGQLRVLRKIKTLLDV